MKTIDIGGSGLVSSSLALGCMRIAGLSIPETEALIDTALEEGITLFDHADIYSDGICEEKFGKVLAQSPSLREKMQLQTKCGIRKGFYDLSREHILHSAEDSLRRLHTDYLDLYLLHRPDSLMEPEEIAEAFDCLSAAGKVRFFGVSNMNPAQIALLRSSVSQKLIVDQMQFSLASSSLVDSGINVNIPASVVGQEDSLLEYCRCENITIQTWSPLQYGFFAGNFLNSEKYPELNKELQSLAEQYRVAPAAIAVAWILRHPARMQVLLGSRSCRHIRELADACRVELSREEWYRLYRSAGNELP